MIKLHLLGNIPVLVKADSFIIHYAIGGELGTQVQTDAGTIRVIEPLEEIERLIREQTSRG